MKAIDGMAFVRLGKCTYLCIGTEKEVEKADENTIRDMVIKALAQSTFKAITSSRGFRIN